MVQLWETECSEIDWPVRKRQQYFDVCGHRFCTEGFVSESVTEIKPVHSALTLCINMNIFHILTPYVYV